MNIMNTNVCEYLYRKNCFEPFRIVKTLRFMSLSKVCRYVLYMLQTLNTLVEIFDGVILMLKINRAPFNQKPRT